MFCENPVGFRCAVLDSRRLCRIRNTASVNANKVSGRHSQSKFAALKCTPLGSTICRRVKLNEIDHKELQQFFVNVLLSYHLQTIF